MIRFGTRHPDWLPAAEALRRILGGVPAVRRRVRSLLFLCLGLGLSLASTGCMFPRWPVEGPVTSAYGLRFRGVKPSVHRGVDIGVLDGTEIRAMARGRVRFAGTMAGYGNVVWLDHPGGVITVYGHLSAIRVRTGEPVRGRQVIGLSGRSGNVTGPHLHFEVWRHGREVDPVPFLGGFPRRRER
jgi:murein DD-endopeptidase MepM/ murein hydrolase activator NlpD